MQMGPQQDVNRTVIQPNRTRRWSTTGLSTLVKAVSCARRTATYWLFPTLWNRMVSVQLLDTWSIPFWVSCRLP
jgi:hypothetical protein